MLLLTGRPSASSNRIHWRAKVVLAKSPARDGSSSGRVFSETAAVAFLFRIKRIHARVFESTRFTPGSRNRRMTHDDSAQIAATRLVRRRAFARVRCGVGASGRETMGGVVASGRGRTRVAR